MYEKVTSITLQKALIAACRRVDPRVAMMVRRSIIRVNDDIARDLVASLDTYMMAMLDETIEIHRQWPADWWQAFKERWLPAWAKRRWPVQYEQIDISERRYKAVCPHIEAPDPKECMVFFYEHAKRGA